MKNIFKSLVMIAAAAFTLVSCSEKETVTNPDENELVTLKFNIRNNDEAITKALLGSENGENFLNWEDGDKIGTYSVGSFGSGNNTSTTSNNNSGTVSVSGNTHTLNVQVFNPGTITNIYSYFPHSAAAGKDKTAAVVSIPETQTMDDHGFDADAMPMAGTPVTVDISATANTDTPCGTINFSNLGSIILFKVYTSGSTTETLTSVTYKATGIGGAFTIDLTGIDAEDESTLTLTSSDLIDEITTSVAGNPSISGLDNAIDVYMVVAPGTYTGSQVVVTTNEHTYTLDASSAKSYTRSHIKPLKVDISKGTQGDLPSPETWIKVTNSSDFTEGEYYILRADGAYYLSNASSGNSAPACNQYTAVSPIPSAMRFTATAGTSGLIFESKAHPGNFLWGSDTNNGIRVNTTYTATGASKEWQFATLSANETTYYTASAVSNRYLISYGTQDWRNYGSASASNIPAEFYKLDDGKTALSSPILSVNGAVVSWSAVTNADHYVVTVNGSSENVSSTSYDLNELNLADGEYSVSVVAVPSNTTKYKNSAAASVVVVIGTPHGTEANPYTVAEARTAIDNGSTASDIYVVGIISEIVTAFNSTYHNVSFNMSDDGLSTSDQFQAFRAVASSADEYAVGDGVIMKGTLKKYNSTYEFDAGCTKVDQIHKPTMTASTSFTDNQTVTISAEDGVTIRYTLDGTNPTATTGSTYTSAFTLTESTTVKAIGVKNGMVTAVVSETFTKSTGGTLKNGSISMTYSSHEGWTISGTGSGSGGGGYYILCSGAFIESPSFTFNSIKSIVIKTRTAGGSSYKTTTVTYGSTTLGTIDASGTSLANKTLTLENSPSAGTGTVKFSSSTSGTSTQGPGIQEITINYDYFE